MSVPTPDTNPFRTVRYETWRETRLKLLEFPVSWVFRGQSDERYSLKTSIERLPSIKTGNSEVGENARPLLEYTILKRFQRQARNFSLGYIPDDKDMLGWLSLLQHHGAPTRLLDWTRSPFVACFFALDGARSDAAVWALDHVWAKNLGRRRLQEILTTEVIAKLPSGREEETVLRVIVEGGSDLSNLFRRGPRFVMPIEPSIANPRVALQHGLFVFPGDITSSFMENMQEQADADAHQRFVKIVLPVTWRAEVLFELLR